MKLNIGCGNDYREGYVNIDVSRAVEADEYFDITDGIPFNSDVFDEIIINNVLCQIEKNDEFVSVINELWRVCSGDIYVRVPNASHICAYQDPMDCRRFTPESFTYLDHRHRRYKQYGKHYGFKPFVVELLSDNGRQMEFKLTPKK